MKTSEIKEEILRQTNGGLLVFQHYSGCKRAHKNFRNPEYDDKRPSCSYFYSDTKHIYLYKDQGNDYKGDCFRFAAGCLGLDCKLQFRQLLETIIRDLNLSIDIDSNNMQSIPQKKQPMAQKPQSPAPNDTAQNDETPKKYEFVEKLFSITELDY